MAADHLAAVWKHSRQSGSTLLVLVAVASHCDASGVWIADQATLQTCTHLSRRRVQQILTELVTAGELAVIPGDGRGHRSTYRLTVASERVQPAAPLHEKDEADCALPTQKGEADCALSAGKGEADCTLPAPPCPPFPPDPLYPLNPPKQQETFGLRPLSGPQSGVFRVNLLLEEAGVPLPSPAQIGLWSKKLGGIEPLLELLGRLVQAGLANKREPIVYAHRVVMERAARPEPARPLDARAGRDLLRAAGGDEIRWQQALEIIANTEVS